MHPEEEKDISLEEYIDILFENLEESKKYLSTGNVKDANVCVDLCLETIDEMKKANWTPIGEDWIMEEREEHDELQ